MNFLKSKTMLFNGILAVLAVLEMHQGLVQNLVGAHRFGAVMLGIAVMGAILRSVTTTALSDK